MEGKIKKRKNKTDRELVEEVLKGDNNAFALLIKSYYKLFLALALHYTHELSLAEDIVQEGLIDIYKSIRTIRDPDMFGSWSYTIIKRQCIKWVLKEKSESHMITRYKEKEKIEETMREGIEHNQRKEEHSKKLLVAIADLPRDYREIVVLHFLEELSPVEIARKLKLSMRTVYVRIYRAKLLLRDMLKGSS